MSDPREMQDAGADRQTMEVDIVCVGFGPAMGGFLTTLSRGLTGPEGTVSAHRYRRPSFASGVGTIGTRSVYSQTCLGSSFFSADPGRTATHRTPGSPQP